MQVLFKKQRGLTFISIVLILCLIGFFAMLVIKIAPIYINHSRVVNALKAEENLPGIATKSKGEIISDLAKRFDMNYVENVSYKDVQVITQPGYVKVDLEYERVEKIFGNLSVLVQFHEGFETGSR